jgi:hypothetical protein
VEVAEVAPGVGQEQDGAGGDPLTYHLQHQVPHLAIGGTILHLDPTPLFLFFLNRDQPSVGGGGEDNTVETLQLLGKKKTFSFSTSGCLYVGVHEGDQKNVIYFHSLKNYLKIKPR